MLNRWTGIGRVGKDTPTLNTTAGGQPYTTFSLACDKPNAKDGTERKPDWIAIKAWGQDAEFAAQYIGSGDLVLVEGRLEFSSFTGQDGQPRKKAEVIAYRGGVTKLSPKAGPKPAEPPAPAPADFEADGDDGPFDEI